MNLERKSSDYARATGRVKSRISGWQESAGDKEDEYIFPPHLRALDPPHHSPSIGLQESSVKLDTQAPCASRIGAIVLPAQGAPLPA